MEFGNNDSNFDQTMNSDMGQYFKFLEGIFKPRLSFRWQRIFLGPRGPLIEPSISVPSVHPSTPIFPEVIDELKHCRQASGTPQIEYFLKAYDVSYPNWDKNSNTETNTKTETNKGRS